MLCIFRVEVELLLILVPYKLDNITASTIITCLVFFHLSFLFMMGYLYWYNDVNLKYILNVPSGSSSISYSLDIFFIV